jgi:hypothetical protein
MAQRNFARVAPQPRDVQPGRDPELCLRRAAECLEEGGLKDAAFWTRMAADYIAEKKREN